MPYSVRFRTKECKPNKLIRCYTAHTVMFTMLKF